MATLASLQNLKDKNILVLGGSGYLGSAACEVFAELGANLIIASRSKKNCDEVINRISKGDNQFHSSIGCDISNKESIQKLAIYANEETYIEKGFGKWISNSKAIFLIDSLIIFISDPTAH